MILIIQQNLCVTVIRLISQKLVQVFSTQGTVAPKSSIQFFSDRELQTSSYY